MAFSSFFSVPQMVFSRKSPTIRASGSGGNDPDLAEFREVFQVVKKSVLNLNRGVQQEDWKSLAYDALAKKFEDNLSLIDKVPGGYRFITRDAGLAEILVESQQYKMSLNGTVRGRQEYKELLGKEEEKDVAFEDLVYVFNGIKKVHTNHQKRSKLQKFLTEKCEGSSCYKDVYSLFLDESRNYGFTEKSLAKSLLKIWEIPEDSDKGKRLLNWHKGAFDFAAEIVLNMISSLSSDLTVKCLNQHLNDLSTKKSSSEKSGILSALIQQTSTKQMTWIIRIILKDLDLGISRKIVVEEFAKVNSHDGK